MAVALPRPQAFQSGPDCQPPVKHHGRPPGISSYIGLSSPPRRPPSRIGRPKLVCLNFEPFPTVAPLSSPSAWRLARYCAPPPLPHQSFAEDFFPRQHSLSQCSFVATRACFALLVLRTRTRFLAHNGYILCGWRKFGLVWFCKWNCSLLGTLPKVKFSYLR